MCLWTSSGGGLQVIDAVYTAIFQRHVRQRQQQQQQQQAVFASSPSRPFSSSAGGGSLLPASLPPHFSLPSFSAVMAGAAGTGGRKEHHGGWRGGDSIFDDAAASAQAALIWCSLAPHDQDELKHLVRKTTSNLSERQTKEAYAIYSAERPPTAYSGQRCRRRVSSCHRACNTSQGLTHVHADILGGRVRAR